MYLGIIAIVLGFIIVSSRSIILRLLLSVDAVVVYVSITLPYTALEPI